MNTKRYLALVMALVMAFSLVVPVSAEEVNVPSAAVKLDANGETTAKMTVYAATAEETKVAAEASINSSMTAELKLNYGSYAANSEVTVYGQTKNHANLTTFSLGGTTSGSGIDFTNEESIETYFPGLNKLTTTYNVRFVNAMGESSAFWDYTFKKYLNGNDVTLTLDAISGSVADEAWDELREEAFTEYHNQPENSYINLAAGSYLQMDDEKLTVKNDLLLDNFSDSEHVNENIERAGENLTYTSLDSTSSNNVYQLLLKEGTQFSLGASIAEVKQDLLVTMTGVSNNYDSDETNNILNDVYTNLGSGSESGLAESLLKVFSDIAGLVGSQEGANPVVITFGKPYTATNTTVDEVSGTTTETSTAITVDTTQNGNEAPTTTVNLTTEVTTKVGAEPPSTATTYKEVPVNTGTEAVISETVKSIQSYAVIDAKNAVTNSAGSATFRAKLANDTGEASETKVLQTAAAANAIAKAAATVPSTDVANVTEAKVILKTELKAVTEDSNNPQNVASVTYDITPVAELYNGSGERLGEPVALKNADIKEGQTFTFNIPVPSTITTNYVKVTHTSTEYGVDVNYYEVQGTGDVRYVTVTVSHFSQFELEETTVVTHGTAKVAANLSLQDEIKINFRVHTLSMDASYYRVEYKFGNNDLVSKNLSNADDKTDGYKFVVASCAAKQMTDTVTFKLYCDDAMIFSIEYSIRQYCENMINANTDPKLVALCRSLLDYGAEAQKYFSYEATNLANAGNYGNGTLPSIDAVYNQLNTSGLASYHSGITNVTANLTLVSRTELNFKLTAEDVGKISNVSVTSSGNETVTKTESTSGNVMTIKVNGIAAKYLDHVYTLSFDYDGTSNSIQYSPLTYAYRNQNKTSDNLGNLCKALYQYWYTAKAYLN